MNPMVTIVLPVHNVERTLRATVLRVLDVAETMGRQVRLAVIDDGSTDGTYEVASELSREFPQVVVLRQPFQSGLGPSLEQVRQRLGAEQVIAHDGVTPMKLDDLAQMMSGSSLDSALLDAPFWDAALEARGSRRQAAPKTLTSGASSTIRLKGSFRWLRLDEPLAPRRSRAAAAPPLAARHDALSGHANTFA